VAVDVALAAAVDDAGDELDGGVQEGEDVLARSVVPVEGRSGR